MMANRTVIVAIRSRCYRSRETHVLVGRLFFGEMEVLPMKGGFVPTADKPTNLPEALLPDCLAKVLGMVTPIGTRTTVLDQ